VAPAATDLALRATYRWTEYDDGLELSLDVIPEGNWPGPLPRIGVGLVLPGALQRVEWFGRGPGEAYPDTGPATRIGRFSRSVEELQTPYLRPQENGSRRDVRWVTITDRLGRGLRVEGRPTFHLTARPWTTEHLAAARHPTDLVPEGHTWLTLDAEQHGIGMASCGPGVLEEYALTPRPISLGVRMRRQG
jgi:beta-galactosidase